MVHDSWNHETPTLSASRCSRLALEMFSVWFCCRNAVPLDFRSSAPMLSGLNEDANESSASGGEQPGVLGGLARLH